MSKPSAGQRVTKEQAEFLINKLGTHRKTNKIQYFCIESLVKGGTYQTNSKFEASDEIDALETMLDAFASQSQIPARILIRPFDPDNRVFKLANGQRIYDD